jgi:hypothetical protein
MLGDMLSPAQYRDALSRLGLTQTAAAHLLAIDARTSRRWARNGVSGQSEILLRLLLVRRITPNDINYARRYRGSFDLCSVAPRGNIHAAAGATEAPEDGNSRAPESTVKS